MVGGSGSRLLRGSLHVRRLGEPFDSDLFCPSAELQKENARQAGRSPLGMKPKTEVLSTHSRTLARRREKVKPWQQKTKDFTTKY